MDDLLFLSGEDFFFKEAQLKVHQPTIREIAHIEEEDFFVGCELLSFSKSSMGLAASEELQSVSDFDVFIMLMQYKNPEIQKQQESVKKVLNLMFPDYTINFHQNQIIFLENDINEEKLIPHFLNSYNFSAFKKILRTMFCLDANKDEVEYNPSGDLSRSIVKKLEERKRKLAEQHKSNGEKINILCRYVSILSVGQQKDMNSILDYTVYQLFDEFNRYQLKMQSDLNYQARLAGAQNLPEVEDWMKDIHSKSEKQNK